MTRKVLLAVAACLSMVVGSAQAAPINLSATSFGAITSVFLDAGTYKINPIGPADGGLYTAWNAWGSVSGCNGSGENCFIGNIWTLSMGSASLGTIYPGPGPNVGNPSARFATAAQALAAAQASLINDVFTLNVGEVVDFKIDDCCYFDNSGGVSFELVLVEDGVPTPGAFALLGLGLAGFRVARRKRN